MHTTRADLATLGRLKSRSEYVAVQRTGQKWVSPTVIVELKATPDAPLRLGFTVSKRTAKKAVDRNRIRRRLKAAAFQASQGLAQADVTLVGRPAALTCDYDALLRDIAWCFKRLGLKNDQ